MNPVLEVKHFPAGGFDNSQLDVMDIRKVYFTGLYERTVTLDDGTERTYKAYIPRTAAYGDDSCYVAVPDGVDTAAFLVESGWIELAERPENPYILFALEPAGRAWGDAAAEVEYIDKAFADICCKSGGGFRNLVFISDFNWRWAGYGRGGEMVMRYALKNPMVFASLAVAGGLEGIGQETLGASARICYTNHTGHTYSEWPNSKIPVPVWLIGCENEGLVQYWKTANECTGGGLALADGWLYTQNPESANPMTFDQKVGQVKVTGAAPSYTDTTLSERISRFLMAFSRCGMNSPYGNMLYPTTADSFFRRETIISDHREREWYVHLPSGYDGKTPLPLVIYFHGHGQTGLIAMRQGGWWQYGDQRGFITVCPTGSLPERTDGQLPLCGWHAGSIRTAGQPPANRSWIGVEECEMENRFVRAMLEWLYEEYNIDRSRIYITGQSNGCAMTQMMAEKGADIFAAAACTGMPILVPHTPLPDFILGGEFDICPVVFTEDHDIASGEIRERFLEALALRGIDYESGGFFQNGRYSSLEWRTADGAPAYRLCCVSGQAHSWRQNDCRLFWDEWFCRYSRDLESGRILYMRK